MDEGVTGAEADLSGDAQLIIALEAIEAAGGVADMQAIYEAVERQLRGRRLSEQGKATLRRIVNTNGVRAEFIYPHDRDNPGWRITPDGRAFLMSRHEPPVTEEVVDVDTRRIRQVPANTVRGAVFEHHIGMLLKQMYPRYAWIHTGKYKRNERGLDFHGTRLSQDESQPSSIGVQVKLHQQNNAPTEIEWLKFLSGCFARRIGQAMFITTGRLTGEQYREAVEANVVVLSGLDEINRQCAQHSIQPFNDQDAEPDR